MLNQHIFEFKTNISEVQVPSELNNPFQAASCEVGKIAAKEFQDFIITASQNWEHDFLIQKGKMFGVLVIQLQTGEFGFIGTVSGKLTGESNSDRLIPSVFDDSTDDFFINRGMTELTEIGKNIECSDNYAEMEALKSARQKKSLALQEKLFENYRFLNVNGDEKNVIEIFENSPHGKPPAAAGECAAPKLLNFALKNHLKPISLVEFWWGNAPKGQARKHKTFYPACKEKCRPILEYMLNDFTLFSIE